MDLLHSAETLNSFFIDQVKDYAIFAMDKNGIITTWNKGGERLKGYKEEETVGQFYGMLFPDEYQHAGKPEEELRSALEKGYYESEDWRKRRDGSLFWAHVMLTPIFSANGEHMGYTKITGDKTKQKELQDKLAERQQIALDKKNTQLEEINLDLDSFIYTASHDLRSPITNIEGLIGYLKDELQNADCLTNDIQEVLQRIGSSVNQFKRTIEDLTEISRLQKHISTEQADEVINIQQVYEEVMAEMGHPDKKDGVMIQTDFQVHQINFSYKNFKSVLYNLLSNAFKFNSPERDTVINIHSRLEEPCVILCIKDNGLGLNERQQEQLYTMFKRFHDHVEGTGIGLYMVKKIVESAGGKIELDSEEGKGSEFKVFINAAM